MSLMATFSRRKRDAERQNSADVYQYDSISRKLRVQTCHVWGEAIGLKNEDNSAGLRLVTSIVELLRKEFGVFELTKKGYYDLDRDELVNWFLGETDTDKCLDAMEIMARAIDIVVRENIGDFRYYIETEPDKAIEELNERMREDGLGYRYEQGMLVRVDAQFLHADVVKPVLALLADARFESANKEFREAHRLYRSGSFEASITECCKALESTLKIIASGRRWPVDEKATAKPLLDAAFASGIIPEYLQGEFTALRALLESGVPTVRNRSAGHGAGTKTREISAHLVAFQLHQTAAAILFLVEADTAQP